ncbi:MAG: hypothetical protein GX879_03570 [Bacteroidales bacterium]|nr:hypothetical protein [Bacteroidales bacterium]
MASKRLLKKDINSMVDELITDSLHYLKVNPEKADKEVAEIISNALILRNELIGKINNAYKEKDRKKIKEIFNSVIFSLIDKIDEGYTQLSKLPR